MSHEGCLSNARPRGRVRRIGAALLLWNVLAWCWALIALRHHPLLIGTALLAYGFGLRHAVDADHIAAIDNVTRKLIEQRKPALTVGLYFSLGHSTVVTVLTVAVALTAGALRHHFDRLNAIGAVVGTAVSALFLLAIAGVNLAILAGTWRGFRAAREARGDTPIALSAPGGVLMRLWRRTFRVIEHSGQMYGLGVLFGLGFDTATEIGLLGVSAAGAARGISLWAVLVLPALFSAGMALIDTADGIAMVGAYGWAFVKPVRKLYYNLTITALSVVVAVIVAGVETLGLIGTWTRMSGGFWGGVESVNRHFGLLGYGIIGVFVLGWLVSVLIYKIRRYETA